MAHKLDHFATTEPAWHGQRDPRYRTIGFWFVCEMVPEEYGPYDTAAEAQAVLDKFDRLPLSMGMRANCPGPHYVEARLR